jgi:hypothetical protein
MEMQVLHIVPKHINFGEIADIPNAEPTIPPDVLNTLYVIGLVNLTQECFTILRTTGNNGKWGDWSSMPRTCNNCTTNYNDCASKGKYQQILVTACNAPAFSIQIAYPLTTGGFSGVTFEGVTPNCSHAGGVLGVY